MKAFEFQATFDDQYVLKVPAELTSHIPQDEPVRIIVLTPDDEEERDWNRLAAEQFMKGYAESDSIYDDVSKG